MPLQPMDWIHLKGKATWKSVQVNCFFMKTVVPDLSLNEGFLMSFHVNKNTAKANSKCAMKKK
jgi:hypothetical protein